MMKKLKRRVTVFLCLLMAFTTVTPFIISQRETVEAKSSWNYVLRGNFGFNDDESKETSDKGCSLLIIPKGIKELSVADLVDEAYAYRCIDENTGKNEYKDMELTGAKYESKNPSIVSVDKKTGKITAKKKGKALIKMTWKGQKLYGFIEVVDTKKMKSFQKENKKNIAASKKLNKIVGKKVTSKNALKAAKPLDECNFQYTAEKEKWIEDEDGYYEWCEYTLYSMDVFKAKMSKEKIEEYFGKINPTREDSKYLFEISSVSGNGKSVTATLSKSISDEQFLGAHYTYQMMCKEELGAKEFSFPMYIRDVENNEYIGATATLKAGSKTINIECAESLSKGKKYELSEYDYYYSDFDVDFSWLYNGNNSFIAE